MLWMAIFLFIIVDIPNKEVIEDRVDMFELNHRFDDNGKIQFDQIIGWEWSTLLITDKQGITRSHREKKVVFWYLLKQEYNREKLTPDEYRAKNKEFGDKWVKKYGLKKFIPDYNPEFLGSIHVPRYDPVRKVWIVILLYRNEMRQIYAKTFFESWSMNDPEADNHKFFPVNSRRSLSPGNFKKRD